MRRRAGWVVVAFGVMRAGQANAEPPAVGLTADVARAAELFEDGRRHVDAGDCAEALTSFRASIQLNDSVGAHLNIANCLPSDPLAQWQELKAAEVLARRKSDRRSEEARSGSEALRPRLALLQIHAPQASGGQLLVDARPIDATFLSEPVAVAAGPHVIELALPDGRRLTARASATVGVVASADLQPDAPPPPVAPAADHESGGLFGNASPLRKTGFLVTGVGVLALGAGAVAAGIAATKVGDAKDACPAYPKCATTAQASVASDLTHSGRSAATDATIALVAGGVLVVGGIVMILVAPHKASTATAWTPGIRW